MRQWWIVTRKEAVELWRTKKFILLISLFFVMGIMNPLTAKLTPLIIENTLGKQVANTMPKPTSLDSWAQFDKNITQIGLYLFALLFSQIIQHEIQQHQLLPLMIKGLKRSQYVLAKFTTVLICWCVAIGLSFSVTYGYTVYYFPDEYSPHPLLAGFSILAFGLFLSAVLIFSSALSKQSFGGILGVVLVMICLYLIQFFDQGKSYSPLALLTQSAPLRTGEVSKTVWIRPLLTTSISVVLFIYGTVLVLKKSKL